MKQLKVISGVQSVLEDTFISSDTIWSGVIGTTEQTVTVPTGADYCFFSANGPFFVNYDTTCSVPSGSLANSGGELNPYVRYIGDISVLHLTAPTSTYISLSFYKKSV